MIKSLDTGAAPNLPVTGWESMLGQGGADSLQQCAILAHSLMSQQFGGVRSPDEESLGPGWDMPLSPMHANMANMGQMDMSHVVSPVRGQQYHHPAQHAQQYHNNHGQLSPHHDNISPVMTPVKMPPSPAHPISPEQYQHHHVSSTNHHHVASPPKKDGFIDNNPGFYRGHGPHTSAVSAPQWAPELAIHPSVPTYDEMSHPPITSSLYGQDLRYNQYY